MVLFIFFHSNFEEEFNGEDQRKYIAFPSAFHKVIYTRVFPFSFGANLARLSWRSRDGKM
jgi:hypothetical protein